MKSPIALFLLLVAMLSFRVIATEPNAADTQRIDRIYIGQSVRDAADILTRLEIPHGEGGFAFASVPDRSNLYVNIDPNHAVACIYYSKSKKQVTDIDMMFFSSKKRRSKMEPMVPATAIRFNADRSYTVTFAAPGIENKLKTSDVAPPTPQLPPAK